VTTPSTTGPVRGVDFVVLPTRDFEAAVAFYGTTLGLPRSVYRPDRRYAEFETGNLTLMVIDPPGMEVERRASRNAVALRVDDVHEWRALLEERDVAFKGETMDSGVCHQAVFADPDGSILILHHRYTPHAGRGRELAGVRPLRFPARRLVDEDGHAVADHLRVD
jgi:catechol 2,3-dioxygenase-like lactoylglutathione lyase family enzyme